MARKKVSSLNSIVAHWYLKLINTGRFHEIYNCKIETKKPFITILIYFRIEADVNYCIPCNFLYANLSNEPNFYFDFSVDTFAITSVAFNEVAVMNAFSFSKLQCEHTIIEVTFIWNRKRFLIRNDFYFSNKIIQQIHILRPEFFFYWYYALWILN